MKNKIRNQGFVLWFTGLPCSGKTTIANGVFNCLSGVLVHLDGDVVRKGLSQDLGFSKEDRDENIRRVGFVSKLLSDNGVNVIASFISPYRGQRRKVRKEVDNFIEVFCDCPLSICEERDNKGLYQKARKGEIEDFTGISAPYEKPENAEIILRTDEQGIKDCINEVIKYLKRDKII